MIKKETDYIISDVKDKKDWEMPDWSYPYGCGLDSGNPAFYIKDYSKRGAGAK